MPPVSKPVLTPQAPPPKKNAAAKFKIFRQQPNNTISRLLKTSQSSRGEAEPSEAGGALTGFTIPPPVPDDAGYGFSTT
jgi:hypothetical protein